MTQNVRTARDKLNKRSSNRLDFNNVQASKALPYSKVTKTDLVVNSSNSHLTVPLGFLKSTNTLSQSTNSTTTSDNSLQGAKIPLNQALQPSIEVRPLNVTFPKTELLESDSNFVRQKIKEEDIFCLTKSKKTSKKRGQRGKQKISPSGHLAPTIQIRKGIFYPRISGLDEQERRARLHDCPEETPHWFVWLYQWKEKDPTTDLWKTRSKRVPLNKIAFVRYAIHTNKPIARILEELG